MIFSLCFYKVIKNKNDYTKNAGLHPSDSHNKSAQTVKSCSSSKESSALSLNSALWSGRVHISYEIFILC